MEWIDALIMGIVQGLSEYLPISSSGHLEIFREILGITLPGDEIVQFDLMLHAATVLSTIVILWPVFARLCRSFFTFRRDADFYYVCKILVSCIPVGVVGVFAEEYVESFFGGSLTTVGICLLATVVLLTFAHFSDQLMSRRADGGRPIGWLDAFVMGCAQAVAVLPGLSRSGTTIATGILLGDRRADVAQFSFLMVIIPILGKALLDVGELASGAAAGAAQPVSAGCMAIGFAASFIVGCAACRWMLSLVRRGRLLGFAAYCLAMGVVCLLWQ